MQFPCHGYVRPTRPPKRHQRAPPRIANPVAMNARPASCVVVCDAGAVSGVAVGDGETEADGAGVAETVAVGEGDAEGVSVGVPVGVGVAGGVGRGVLGGAVGVGVGDAAVTMTVPVMKLWIPQT